MVYLTTNSDKSKKVQIDISSKLHFKTLMVFTTKILVPVFVSRNYRFKFSISDST